MLSKYLKVIIIVLMSGSVFGQQKVDLYPNEVPNVKDGADLGENTPEVYLFKPEKITSNIAFLIIPGGGYSRVAIQHEGYDVALKLNNLGYSAFVLKYRLPNANQQIDKRIAPIQDAQSTLSFIRSNAVKLGLGDVKYVGVLGFSAGGHLASTLSTQFNFDYVKGVKATKKAKLRPDFSVLCYPVISMDDAITHKGSKLNLIGPEVSTADVQRFSNELNISKDTPPTFIMHAVDDKGVPIANSERYMVNLKRKHVKYSSFIYQTGGHGFGLNNKTDARSWFDEMMQWVSTLDFKK